jgi:hypothetical protein
MFSFKSLFDNIRANKWKQRANKSFAGGPPLASSDILDAVERAAEALHKSDLTVALVRLECKPERAKPFIDIVRGFPAHIDREHRRRLQKWFPVDAVPAHQCYKTASRLGAVTACNPCLNN